MLHATIGAMRKIEEYSNVFHARIKMFKIKMVRKRRKRIGKEYANVISKTCGRGIGGQRSWRKKKY